MSEYICGTDGHEGHWLTGEQIVRCRDCEHCREHDMRRYGGKCDQLLCHHFSTINSAGWPVEPDGFCAWGESKENE